MRGPSAYYRATWEGALAAKPVWAVVVSTFNEWMEAREIETSVRYGDLYLQITRQQADHFKGVGVAAAPAALDAEPQVSPW